MSVLGRDLLECGDSSPLAFFPRPNAQPLGPVLYARGRSTGPPCSARARLRSLECGDSSPLSFFPRPNARPTGPVLCAHGRSTGPPCSTRARLRSLECGDSSPLSFFPRPNAQPTGPVLCARGRSTSPPCSARGRLRISVSRHCVVRPPANAYHEGDDQQSMFTWPVARPIPRDNAHDNRNPRHADRVAIESGTSHVRRRSPR
jgi:hypothetical protein